MSAENLFADLVSFDSREALERCMGSKDFVMELARIFIDQSLPMYMPGLEAGVRSGDPDQVAQNAHGIKGGCAVIGLVRAREISLALEQAGKRGDLDLAGKLLPLLKSELDLVAELIHNGIFVQ
ncbi:Hpt domain-containing protein [Desulfonatronovibrio hydrogenovorans]|uniref:Hpt domain-containing protein n=1 Tax=Desulfonatronovibrio hydrogenovorans TaxID=53245 RepID=UPI001377C359|nr:Hpt domain-containing protein [Desulfonatronovibrio hydrogenovorans]